MSKNATSQTSARRPDGASERDNPEIDTKDFEGRPLRSVEEMLNERLDRRDRNGESGPNLSGNARERSRGQKDEVLEDEGSEQEPIDAES
ncbi:MAG TPA: hypothetical protein VG796_14410 [Verrucomicrobiales bacterium]|jgi:hypothetical protein|nr:hypothetical protein [Verrucomicrobiales bacterium]